MKKYLFTIALFIYILPTFSQGVGINNDGSAPDAMLHVKADGRTDSLIIFTNDKDATKDSVMVITSKGHVGIGTTSPSSTHHISGSSAAKTSTITAANYTAGDETVILADASSNKITINLPTAAVVTDRIYTIKKIDNSTDSVVIAPNGAETIDGNTNIYLNRQNEFYTIISNGTNWYITSSSSPVVSAVKGLYVKGSSQTVPNATYTTFTNYTTVVRNDFSAGMVAGVFTVPAGEAGWYNINIMQTQGYLNAGAISSFNTDVFLRINGVLTMGQGANQAQPPNAFWQNASTTLYLNAGDTVEGQIYQSTGQTRNSRLDLSIVKQ